MEALKKGMAGDHTSSSLIPYPSPYLTLEDAIYLIDGKGPRVTIVNNHDIIKSMALICLKNVAFQRKIIIMYKRYLIVQQDICWPVSQSSQ